MAYTKTAWNEGIAPGISAINLNHLETQYDESLKDGQGHITILPPSYNSIGQGTWPWVAALASDLWISNTSDADGDNLTYKVWLAQGTYTLMLMAYVSGASGILDVDISGVEVASFDLYAAVAVERERRIQAAIAVAVGGLKDLRLRVDGKNGASAGFLAQYSYLALWRTA